MRAALREGSVDLRIAPLEGSVAFAPREVADVAGGNDVDGRAAEFPLGGASEALALPLGAGIGALAFSVGVAAGFVEIAAV